MFKRVVFWEPCISPHKADFIAAVAKLIPNVEVICIAESDLLPDRRDMGWSVNPPNGYTQIIAPSESECIACIQTATETTFHVFSGLRHIPSIVIGLRHSVLSSAHFGIMSEPRVGEGIKGILRYIQSWVTEGSLRSSASVIFAIGRNGPPWFLSVGYPEKKIIPFAYFIEQPKRLTTRHRLPEKPLRVGYLGRLVPLKGIEYLIDACQNVADLPVELVIGGTGPSEQLLLRKSASLDVSVNFLGRIELEDVGAFLSDIDILVLPSISKDDGWGVVVSEALMAGRPVIATTCVGASIVLSNPLLGCCVKPKSSRDISSAIRMIASSEMLSPNMIAARREWSLCNLSSEAGANHFIQVVNNIMSNASPTNQMN